MSKTAEDVAAAVSAPGQESFKTPDITIPVDDASDDPNRFGGDVDWDKALDDSEDEPEVAAEAAPAVKLAEDEPKPAVDVRDSTSRRTSSPLTVIETSGMDSPCSRVVGLFPGLPRGETYIMRL